MKQKGLTTSMTLKKNYTCYFIFSEKKNIENSTIIMAETLYVLNWNDVSSSLKPCTETMQVLY